MILVKLENEKKGGKNTKVKDDEVKKATKKLDKIYIILIQLYLKNKKIDECRKLL